MKNGTVKWFNDEKGYGFIESPETPEGDVFVHHRVIAMDGRRTLKEGQRVAFEAEPGPKGLKATTVVPV